MEYLENASLLLINFKASILTLEVSAKVLMEIISLAHLLPLAANSF
jgi:hypothetical protein